MIRHQMVRLDHIPDREAFAPSKMPDRVNLTWRGDPSTTQVVSWRTAAYRDNRGFGQITKAADGPLFRHDTVYGKAPRTLETNLGVANYHMVEFTDLEPDTEYMYRVGDGMNWTEWNHFRTAPAPGQPQPFSFVYFGDWQEDIRSQVSRVARQAFRDAPYARFWLYAGDLVDNGHNDGEWGEFFEAHGWISSMIPMIPTPGNHEYSRGFLPFERPDHSFLSMQWRHQFGLPEHGPAGAEETVYYIDYNGVRIISLDSNLQKEWYNNLRKEYGEETDRKTAITMWLEDALESNDQNWTVVVFHHPIFTHQPRGDHEILEWLPVLEKHQVDLVLQGHDHAYFRTGEQSFNHDIMVKDGKGGWKPIRLDPNSGTVYVSSMAGSKQRTIQTWDDWIVRGSEDLQVYHIVHVDTDSIHFQTKTATGKLYDAFTLHKQPDGRPNRIIDHIPDGVGIARRDEKIRSMEPGAIRTWFYHEREFADPRR